MTSKIEKTKKIDSSSEGSKVITNNGKKKKKLRIFLLVFLNVAIVGTLVAGAIYHHVIKKNKGHTITLTQPSADKGYTATINGSAGPVKIKKDEEVTVIVEANIESPELAPTQLIITLKDGATYNIALVRESGNTYAVTFKYEYDQDATISFEFRLKALEDYAYINIGDKNYVTEWNSVCSTDKYKKLIFVNIKDKTDIQEFDRETFNVADVHIGSSVDFVEDDVGFMANCTNFDKKVIFDSKSNVTRIPDSFMINCPKFGGLTNDDETFIPSTVVEIGKDFMANDTVFNMKMELQNCKNIGTGFLQNCSYYNKSFSLSSIETIGFGFMANCWSFAQKLVIPNTAIAIEPVFMVNCTSFTEIEINIEHMPYDPTVLSDLVAKDQTPPEHIIKITGTAAGVLKSKLKSISHVPGKECWVRTLQYE